MSKGQTVFSQIMDFLPIYEFRKCVKRYNGDYRVKNFTCWNQFLSLAFAQLTYRESLRDIESCLNSMSRRLYHMGFRGKISKSTLADAKEKRPWQIYADFAQVMINRARILYKDWILLPKGNQSFIQGFLSNVLSFSSSINWCPIINSQLLP